jgi:hypothetical protein
VTFSIVYLAVRCLPSGLMVLTRRQMSKDAELLVLRHENAVLRRQISRVRYQPGGRLWLAALSRQIPRRRWGETFAVTKRLADHRIRRKQVLRGLTHEYYVATLRCYGNAAHHPNRIFRAPQGPTMPA